MLKTNIKKTSITLEVAAIPGQETEAEKVYEISVCYNHLSPEERNIVIKVMLHFSSVFNTEHGDNGTRYAVTTKAYTEQLLNSFLRALKEDHFNQYFTVTIETKSYATQRPLFKVDSLNNLREALAEAGSPHLRRSGSISPRTDGVGSPSSVLSFSSGPAPESNPTYRATREYGKTPPTPLSNKLSSPG